MLSIRCIHWYLLLERSVPNGMVRLKLRKHNSPTRQMGEGFGEGGLLASVQQHALTMVWIIAEIFLAQHNYG